MKKILLFILNIALTIILSITTSATDFYANEPSPIDFSAEGMLNDLWENHLKESVPDSVSEALEQDGDDDSPFYLLSPSKLWSTIRETILGKITKPLEIAGRLIGCILICALLSAVYDTHSNQEIQTIFFVVSAVCVVSLLQGPILDCITATTQVLRESSLFLMSFVPVMSGVMVAGGHPASAGIYNVMLFFVAEVLATLTTDFLVPLLSIYLALCMMAPVAPFLHINKITSAIKSIVCWSLSIITTVFVSMLSIQTAIGQGGDSIMLKTSKFLVGNMIPVIGGTISDALETAKGCLLAVKNVVGSFGIIATVLMLLPTMVEVCLWYIMAKVSSWIAEMLDTKEIGMILNSISQTFSMLIAMIGCFMLLFLVSTALMIHISII